MSFLRPLPSLELGIRRLVLRWLSPHPLGSKGQRLPHFFFFFAIQSLETAQEDVTHREFFMNLA